MLWFVMVLAVPTAVPIFSISARNLLLLLALAVALCGALALERFRFAPALLAAVVIAPSFVLPLPGARPELSAPESRWPRRSWPSSPARKLPRTRCSCLRDAGSSPDPSIFRAESLNVPSMSIGSPVDR